MSERPTPETAFIWNKGEEEFLRKVMKTSPWQPLAAELQKTQDQRDFAMSEIERLRKERDQARAQYQTTHLLAEALAKTQVELKAELEARK